VGEEWQMTARSTGTAKPGEVTQQERDELRSLQSGRNAASTRIAQFWNQGSTVRWNEIARSLVMKYKTSPPVAARQYAAISVAQYDALVAAYKLKYKFKRAAPSTIDSTIKPLFADEADPVYPSTHAVVAGASARILAKFYPAEAQFLADKARENQESRLYAGLNFRSDIVAGDALGREVADKVLARIAKDGADGQLGTPSGPKGWWANKTRADKDHRVDPNDPSRWTGTNPLLPRWGQVKPWLVPSVVALRPPAPPKLGSPEFNASLAEVRKISDTRTAEQLRIAQFWADGAGTATPPGHWNEIACDLLLQKDMSELRSARTLSLMNMALMDASICCWDAKYQFYLLRPWMADANITTPVGQPNFPAYTSGHSTFSGAAAEVLGYIFPDKKSKIDAMAQEASVSRIYGGIHFDFDCTEGLKGGRKIGQYAIARGQRDGSA
jgi:membrane-associated phospholipid phosphatase